MKYALLLALSHKAELLIMDEPASGLDPFLRSQLLTMLKDFMKEVGKGVSFSTQIAADHGRLPAGSLLFRIDNGRDRFVIRSWHRPTCGTLFCGTVLSYIARFDQ